MAATKKKTTKSKTPAASKKAAAPKARAPREAPGDEMDTAEANPNYAKGKWAWVFKRAEGEVRYWLVKSEPDIFSFDDLLAVRRIALPGALLQIAFATALGVGVTWLWGWSLAAGIVFGDRLREIAHRRGELALRAAELLEHQIGQHRIGLAYANRVLQTLVVRKH